MSANIKNKHKAFYLKEKEFLDNDLNIPLYKNNINIRIKKIRAYSCEFENRNINIENLIDNKDEEELKVNANYNNSQIISILDSYKDKEKKKRSYNIGFKVKLVEYINSIQNDELRKREKLCLRNKYNIPKNTLNDWFKKYNIFKNEKNDKIKRISGGGRKSNLEEFKKDLLYYILDIRRSGFAINVKTIIAYLYSINDNFKKENIHSLEMKIRRFLERNNLRIRKASHIGQPLPDNATDLIYE